MGHMVYHWTGPREQDGPWSEERRIGGSSYHIAECSSSDQKKRAVFSKEKKQTPRKDRGLQEFVCLGPESKSDFYCYSQDTHIYIS